ncbi:MAG: dTDP-4-dehydrorhamnose 3,5-epimerase family protein [Candidatus Nanopelagicales bacterium]|nr:dTDP-4-dehydrorhamnose 3,5-epimerase family protein [Candidatus Nanopelagicales bacterium]
MQVNELAIEGVWSFTPLQRPDDRGVFLEAFKADMLRTASGHSLALEQMNISVSKLGTVRGVHFAQVPPGQAKYVQCFSGRILDIVVDIRVGSPTFGQWDAIELNDENRIGLYISEGLGHAFCALSDSVTVGYLCSEPYAPGREHGIHPLDPALGLPFPEGTAALLSPKDAAAPTLAQAAELGLLPTYDECKSFIATLK